MEPDTFGRAALIVVDMQNDFVRRGAPLEVPDARVTIEPHCALLSAFRARNWTVVYTRFLSRTEPCLLWNWSPQCRPPTKCCWKGHRRHYIDVGRELECTDVIEELGPASGDVIIDKYGYGAFHDTPLADTLHGRGIESLIVTCTVKQKIVEGNAPEALQKGISNTNV